MGHELHGSQSTIIEELDSDSKGGSSVDKKDYIEINPDEGKSDGIGYWSAVAHMIRAAVCTTILLLPFQMKKLGYINGTLLLLAVSIVYYHILHILLYLDFRLRKHLKVPYLTYANIADEIFAIASFPFNKCRQSVVILIYIYYIVPPSKSISLLVISNNIQSTAKFYNIHLDPFNVLTALTVVLTIFCMFRSILKILVPFSAAANIFTFVIAIVIIIYSNIYRNEKATVRPFGDINFIFQGMMIFLNSFRSTDIILPVKNGMKEPHKLGEKFGCLNVTGFIVVIFYFCIALIPYLNFGDDVSDNILSNIPVNNWLIFSVNLGYSFVLSVSYILSFYSCFDVVWTSKLQTNLQNSKYNSVVEYGIRLSLNGVAYFLALGATNLNLIAAVGGIIGILLDVAFMPLLQIMLMCTLEEKNYSLIYKNIALIIISLVLLVVSIISCVEEVITLYS